MSQTDCITLFFKVKDIRRDRDTPANESTSYHTIMRTHQRNEIPPRPNYDKRTRTVGGSIVVVAKCPVPGSSKTSLIPVAGPEGAARIARAALADVLTTLSNASFATPQRQDNNNRHSQVVVDRILLYAPPTHTGKKHITDFCRAHRITLQQVGGSWKSNAWTLIPMTISNHVFHHTRQSKYALSELMESALYRARQRQHHPSPVIFLGMDAPQIPLDEIAHALGHPHEARLCPTTDGGYGLLSVPTTTTVVEQQPSQNSSVTTTTTSIFDGVRWGDPLTAISQIKALTDQNIPVTLGRLMYNVDEPKDVMQLVERLALQEKQESVELLAEEEGDDDDNIKNNNDIYNTEQRDDVPVVAAVSDSITHGNDVLLRSSNRAKILEFACPWTQRALKEIDLWSPFVSHARTMEMVDVEVSLPSSSSLLSQQSRDIPAERMAAYELQKSSTYSL